MDEKKGKEAIGKPVEEPVMMPAGVQASEATPLVIEEPKVQPGKPDRDAGGSGNQGKPLPHK